MRIKLAPQKKQKKVELIQEIFLSKVLGFEGAMITDLSRISHFFRWQPEIAVRKGKVPGTYVFRSKSYVGPSVSIKEDQGRYFREHKDPKNWVEKECELEPDPSKQEIIQKTKDVFGVDISSVYDGFIVDILLHIAKNFVPGKK